MTREERAELCRRIAPHGGQALYAKVGSHGMRIRGKAGFASLAAKHGRHNALALVYGKGWHGRRPEQLMLDLEFGRMLAERH